MGTALYELEVVLRKSERIPPPAKGKKACNAKGRIRPTAFSGGERG
jgi:hypothetical protein